MWPASGVRPRRPRRSGAEALLRPVCPTRAAWSQAVWSGPTGDRPFTTSQATPDASYVVYHAQPRSETTPQRPAGGVQPDGRVQRQRAAADPDGEEVVVGRPTLPQPFGPADQRPEAWRVGVEVVGGGGHLRQVGEVAGPLAAPGPAGGPPLDQAQPDAERQRGDGGAGDGGDQQRVPGPRDGEQERQRSGAA